METVAPHYVETSTRKTNNKEVDDFKSFSTTRMIPMLFKADTRTRSKNRNIGERIRWQTLKYQASYQVPQVFQIVGMLQRLNSSVEVNWHNYNSSNPLTTNQCSRFFRIKLTQIHIQVLLMYHIKTIRAAATDEPAGLAFVDNTTTRLQIHEVMYQSVQSS